MSIGTDKISGTVNDSDSDDGSYSELSDSNMSKVNSAVPMEKRKFSSQNMAQAGREHAGPLLTHKYRF